MSNPRTLVKQLIHSGMKECEIGSALRAEGIDVTDPTINRIKSGKIKRTSFDIGLALMRLCERRGATSKHAA